VSHESPFDKLVGTDLREVSADRVVATVLLDEDRHTQPVGLVHGGVYTTVIETVASVGAQAWLGDAGYIVGISNHTDFLRGIRAGEVRFEATPLQRGRTTQLWQVDVTDEHGERIAHGRVRLFNRRD
jgi:uncharacterized protein (TIGR00369 family)